MTIKTPLDDDIRDRLRQLAGEVSQIDIARKTGESRANVSRYLQGVRVPATFCAQLAETMGVNPIWLLTGKGSGKMSDVSEPARRLASDLLEVVQAMGQVEKMRLGAISGKEHLQTLKELGEALDAYERLRAALDKRTEPALEELWNEYDQAVFRRDFDAASRLRRTMSEVLRISTSEKMRLKFTETVFKHEYAMGRSEASIATGYELMHRYVVAGPAHIGDAIANTGALAKGLFQASRLAEAQNVAYLGMALARGAPEDLADHRLELRNVEALLEMELGNLHEGLALAERLAPLQSEEVYRVTVYPLLLRGRLFAGNLRADGALSEMTAPHHPQGLLRTVMYVVLEFACWEENAGALDRVLALVEAGASPEMRAGMFRAEYATLMRDALKDAGFSPDWKGRLEKSEGSLNRRAAVTKDLALSVCVAALAVAAKDTAFATRETQRAARLLDDIPTAVTLDHMLAAMHHRNVLRLASERPSRAGWLAEAKPRAQAYFDEMLARGYGCFAGLASPGVRAKLRWKAGTLECAP